MSVLLPRGVIAQRDASAFVCILYHGIIAQRDECVSWFIYLFILWLSDESDAVN